MKEKGKWIAQKQIHVLSPKWKALLRRASAVKAKKDISEHSNHSTLLCYKAPREYLKTLQTWIITKKVWNVWIGIEKGVNML